MSYDRIVEIEKGRYDHIIEVKKFNPYHDERGRFTSAPGGGMSLGFGGRLSFESSREKVSGTLREVEKRNMDLDHEVVTVINPDSGKALFEKGGSESHVSFNRSEMMEIRGMVLTHNHPIEATFSPADVAIAYNTKAIRATTRSGLVYELSGMTNKQAVAAYRDSYLEAWEGALNSMGIHEFKGLSELAPNQKTAVLSAVTEKMDKWLVDNSAKYGYKYQKGGIDE